MDPSNTVIDEVFSQLSPTDEQKLVSLPYRMGLYVSYADVTGGWEAQEKELQSLTSILQQFSRDFYKTEFTQKVLMDALASRGQWPVWAKDIERVPAEAAHIKALLKSLLNSEEINVFNSVLIEIAVSVAMAFRESRAADEDTARPPIVRELLSRFIKGEGSDDPLDHVNISDSEKSALRALMAALEYNKH